MPTILAQAIATPTQITAFLPFIGLAVLAYLLYQVFSKKEEKFIKLMKFPNSAVILLILIAMALIPASTLALLGFLTPTALILTQIFSVVFIAYMLADSIFYVVAHFIPETLE
jgi:hypothetical protein